jgi:hypothetical protein
MPYKIRNLLHNSQFIEGYSPRTYQYLNIWCVVTKSRNPVMFNLKICNHDNKAPDLKINLCHIYSFLTLVSIWVIWRGMNLYKSLLIVIQCRERCEERTFPVNCYNFNTHHTSYVLQFCWLSLVVDRKDFGTNNCTNASVNWNLGYQTKFTWFIASGSYEAPRSPTSIKTHLRKNKLFILSNVTCSGFQVVFIYRCSQFNCSKPLSSAWDLFMQT